MYREKPTQTLTPLYEVQKAAILSHKVKNKNINPNLRCNNRRNGDKIDTLDTHTLFTLLTGFRQNRYSWHTYFIVYFLDWVQTKSILLTHILYCLLSWLGSDKIDTLDTHTLLFTFLTGFRQNRYSWHTYFIVYFLDWVQTKSILLTHILYCLLSWLGSDIIDTLDTHTLLFTFLTGFRQNRYSWHTYFIVYFLDWVQT